MLVPVTVIASTDAAADPACCASAGIMAALDAMSAMTDAANSKRRDFWRMTSPLCVREFCFALFITIASGRLASSIRSTLGVSSGEMILRGPRQRIQTYKLLRHCGADARKA
jgi:hypothetical protein